VRKKARSEKPSRVCDGTDDEARDGHVDVRRPYRGRRANNNNNNNNNNAGNYSGFRARSRTRATRADGGDGGERAVADAGEEEEGDTVNGHYKNTGRGGAERSDSETGRVRTRRRGRERVDDVVRGREGAGNAKIHCLATGDGCFHWVSPFLKFRILWNLANRVWISAKSQSCKDAKEEGEAIEV